jgi:hypothetical protein
MLKLFNTNAVGPKHGAALAMDGGMADTACYYTGRGQGKGIRQKITEIKMHLLFN